MRSRRDFLSLLTSVAVLSLTLSIAILLATQAVIAGFDRELRDRILGIVPHVNLHSRAGFFDPQQAVELAQRSGEVEVASGVVEVRALAIPSASKNADGQSSPRNQMRGLWILGIDEDTGFEAFSLHEYLGEDEIDALNRNGFRIFLGDSVAAELGVTEGDSITAVLPRISFSVFGPMALQKRLEVAAIFDTGTFLDSSLAFMRKDDAVHLAGHKDGSNLVVLKLEDPFDAVSEAYQLEYRLGDSSFFTSTWRAWLGGLDVAIKSSKRVFLLLLSVLVAVAAFNLLSSVALLVNERSSDIAILRSMGAGDGTILGAMLVVGLSITFVGVCVGVLCGWLLATGLSFGFPLLERILDMKLMSAYAVTTLPVAFRQEDVVVVALVGLVLGCLGSLYAAWHASRSNPADVLRYD